MSKVTFSRSESWHSGWRGKQSSVTIKLDGVEVGRIRGEENAAIQAMSYAVERKYDDCAPGGAYVPIGDRFDSQAEAKVFAAQQEWQ